MARNMIVMALAMATGTAGSAAVSKTSWLLTSAAADDMIAWTVTNANGSISVPASVPGVAHMALMEANILTEDPLYRYNELNYAWVALEDFTYTGIFDTPSGLSATTHLEFDGIDTVAEVWLNGQLLGAPRSLFLQHDYDVSGVLAAEGQPNTLEVRLSSAAGHAHDQAAAYPYAVPETSNYNVWAEPSNRNFVRKAGSDWGWDWGPAYVPSGIPGDVRLVSSAAGRLVGATVAQDHTATDGSVTLRVEALVKPNAAAEAPEVTARAVLRHHKGAKAGAALVEAAVTQKLDAGSCGATQEGGSVQRLVLELVVDAAQVELWWPNGYGEAHLYELDLSLVDEHTHNAEQTLRKRIGLRTIELVQDPLPANVYGKEGNSFYFTVNDVPVFAKGSNWIPADIFTPRVSDADLYSLLSAAQLTNQNMVRVWGGGIYQPDAFYDACDELGLMVWEEIMFACALYPRDSDFLQLVTQEVTQQITRLQSHPSIAIWGGSNENEVALTWFAESETNPNLYVADYTKLYLDTVRPAILAADPTGTAFVDSSPSNELVSDGDPYVKRWNDTGAYEYGDVHYYNYASDCEDYTTYPQARFVSEHGFQSFPSMDTYKHVIEAEDMSRDSDLLAYRQRHEGGNDQVEAMMARHFNVPPANATSEEGQQKVLDDYLWLTQLQQARCYETALTQWRRLKSTDYMESGANTMGVLYWQLNDIWQGPSWASVEYGGKWKVTQYAVKNAYAPLLVSAIEVRKSAAATVGAGTVGPAEATRSPSAATTATAAAVDSAKTGEVEVYVTSDINADISGTVTVSAARFDAAADDAPVVVASTDYAMDALGAGQVLTTSVDDVLAAVGASERSEAFVLVVATSGEGDDAQTSVTYLYLDDFSNVALQPAAIETTVESESSRASKTMATITLTSNATAAFVYLETDHAILPGHFSNNAFHLLPGDKNLASVEFIGDSEFTTEELEAVLTVRSLRDTY